MNKEKLAKKYAEDKGLHSFVFSKEMREHFIAGYDAAQSQQDEFTISFAIWYAKLKNEVTTDYLNMSDYELLEIFKESLNKKQL